ncbi:MAG: alanine racemase [Candidatus Liptonbacteria bacterium]|nr:alanine racemase [Candidatus Liptonbacteria bacterium]
MRKHLKTWVEIKESAVKHNVEIFKKLIGPRPKLYAVVKSNAYGHGLLDFSKLADHYGVNGFCVDSVFEGEKLREAGIKKPILVLGMTLKDNFPLAARLKLILTVSNFAIMQDWLCAKEKPEIHIKVDTGMNRQGFFLNELPKVIRLVNGQASDVRYRLKGAYTHFASAKDINYPAYTKMQFAKFLKAVALFERAGFTDLTKHCAASGGAMLNPKYHLDMVRVGMGLYGHPPSKEIGIQVPGVKLKPVLAWKTIVSEVKNVPKGSFISYDLTEKLYRKSRVAVIPIGYWHGFPWALSNYGEVKIRGKSARVLGRVTMDVMMVDVTDIPACKPYDMAEIDIMSSSFRARTSHYEFLTRINPLIERIIV